jgi:hypothetical protein
MGRTRVVSFTVHERADPPSDRIDRGEMLVFIKEGFTLSAALFAPLWLLMHRLWWSLLGYALVVTALVLSRALGVLPNPWPSLGVVAVHAFVGLEADAFYRAKLARRGWAMLGTVSGRAREDCERRFFDTWLPAQPILARLAPADGPRRRALAWFAAFRPWR